MDWCRLEGVEASKAWRGTMQRGRTSHTAHLGTVRNARAHQRGAQRSAARRGARNCPSSTSRWSSPAPWRPSAGIEHARVRPARLKTPPRTFFFFMGSLLGEHQDHLLDVTASRLKEHLVIRHVHKAHIGELLQLY